MPWSEDESDPFTDSLSLKHPYNSLMHPQCVLRSSYSTLPPPNAITSITPLKGVIYPASCPASFPPPSIPQAQKWKWCCQKSKLLIAHLWLKLPHGSCWPRKGATGCPMIPVSLQSDHHLSASPLTWHPTLQLNGLAITKWFVSSSNVPSCLLTLTPGF